MTVDYKFESYVILDTTKTEAQQYEHNALFESYVILDTTKTFRHCVSI